jgi:hypothetical protein
MNALYKELILIRAQAAMGGARAATLIDHPGLQGQLCEIVTRDLLRPLLPEYIGVGTGKVISAYDQKSLQQDIVIFDKSILPPFLFDGATGVFPIESVLFTIEIKAKLTSQQLKRAIDNAVQLSSLDILSGIYNEAGEYKSSLLFRPISAILAFESDLSVKTEVERFDQKRRHAANEPPIHLICVVGRGCWRWTLTSGWKPYANSYPLQDLVSFIAFIMNSYKEIALTRGAPRLGEYLLND